MSQRVLFCHRGDIFGEQKIVTEGTFLRSQKEHKFLEEALF